MNDRDKMKMIIAAYKNDISKMTFLEPEWKIISARNEGFSHYGFDSIAAINEQSKQIIFACAGTNFTDPKDLYTVLQIFANIEPSQFTFGMKKFVNNILENIENPKDFDINFTGHSMGSVNATLAGVFFADQGFKTSVTSYDGIPSSSLASPKNDTNSYNIINFQATPTFYNSGNHLGKSLPMKVKLPENLSFFEKSNPIIDASHNPKSILNSLDENGFIQILLGEESYEQS